MSSSFDLQTSEGSRGTSLSWAQERWEPEVQEVEEGAPGRSIKQQSTAWWWREWAPTSTPWRSNTPASNGGSSNRLCNFTYAQVITGRITNVSTMVSSHRLVKLFLLSCSLFSHLYQWRNNFSLIIKLLFEDSVPNAQRMQQNQC